MQQIIDISTPDDGLGDVLRDGFDKVNQNTTELYNGKVDKVVGKGLTENDFTDADKAKLDGIEAGAQVNVNSDFGENDPDAPGYILNRPPSMYASVGYFDYNDLATQTTPLVLVSGVNKKLTNDTLGVYTNIGEAPYGVANIWNQSVNQFDFSQLSVGDTLDLRVDALLTTTGTNKTYKVFLKLGIGTASEFTTLVGSGELKVAVTDENIVKEISFYIGSEDVRTAPAELYVLVDTSGSLKVNGWYTRVIRKGLNIIEVTGNYLSKAPADYTDATLPLTGTETAVLNDGTNWVKITWNNIKAQLKTYFDTIYAPIGGGGGANKRTVAFRSIYNGTLVTASNSWWTTLSGLTVDGAMSIVAALTPADNFASLAVQNPGYIVPFNCRLKSITVKGFSNTGQGDVDLALVSGTSIGVGLNLINTTILSNQTFATNVYNGFASSSFSKVFDTGFTNYVIPKGYEIRSVMNNRNVGKNLLACVMIYEFEEEL